MNVPGFRSISELLAFVPGTVGMKVRRFWYKHTLARCGERLFVDWMGVIRNHRAEIGNDVYFGIFSWVSMVTVGNNVLVSGHCTLPSGRHTHGIARNQLIRSQPVTHERIHIGNDVWISNGCTILADVADGTVVAAGAVVTKPTEPYSIVAGVPARKIGERQ